MADQVKAYIDCENKAEFLTSLGLVSYKDAEDMKKEIYEIPRKSLAFTLDLYTREERRPKTLLCCPMVQDGSGQGAGVPVSERSDNHEDLCSACKGRGRLLMCDSCPLVFHLHCLSPALDDIPDGAWHCTACSEAMAKKKKIKQTKAKENGSSSKKSMPSSLRKTGRFSTLRRVSEKQSYLAKQRRMLESQVKDMTRAINDHLTLKVELMQNISDIKARIDKLHSFLRLFA